MKRILVTGGSGFLGANLVRRFLWQGDEIHLFLRQNQKHWRLHDIAESLGVHIVDLRDREQVALKVAQIKPDWVFHLAAYGAYPTQNDLSQIIQTNLMGTVNLIDACCEVGVEVFINSGSSSEYGYKDHAPTELARLDPNSSYALSKAAATHYCKLLAETRGIAATTFRLYSVYGPYEEASRFIPTLILRGLAGELPPLVNADTARDYVYTEDVLDAYELAAKDPKKVTGEVFNVGTGIQTSIREMVNLAKASFQISAIPQWNSMDSRSWDTNTWVADSSKIQRELGWKPKHPLNSGFVKTAKWFRENASFFEHYTNAALRVSDKAL